MPPRPCHHVLSLLSTAARPGLGATPQGHGCVVDTSRGWGLTGRSRSAGALGAGRAAWPDPRGPSMLRRAVASSLAGPGGGAAWVHFYINFITLAAMSGTDQGAQGRGRAPVREPLASNTPRHPTGTRRWGPAGPTPTGGTPSSANGPEGSLGRVGRLPGPAEETGPSVLGGLDRRLFLGPRHSRVPHLAGSHAVSPRRALPRSGR